MERRLSAALAAGALPTVTKRVTAAAEVPEEASEGVTMLSAVIPLVPSTGGLFDDEAPWPTDAAGESAFLAEARERGEPAIAALPAGVAKAGEVEDEKGPLPGLDEMMQRIPPEVREVLEELYRAKFTAVRRVPAKHLKA